MGGELDDANTVEELNAGPLSFSMKRLEVLKGGKMDRVSSCPSRAIIPDWLPLRGLQAVARGFGEFSTGRVEDLDHDGVNLRSQGLDEVASDVKSGPEAWSSSDLRIESVFLQLENFPGGRSFGDDFTSAGFTEGEFGEEVILRRLQYFRKGGPPRGFRGGAGDQRRGGSDEDNPFREMADLREN